MAGMSFFRTLFAPKPDRRDALRPLWHAVVAEARQPQWYAECGVADTVAGRFDMVCAVLAAVHVRMEAGEEITGESVLLTELFVHDMDGQLREFGIGDVVVGKHVTKLMGAMGGRLAAYREGLAGDDATLSAAVERNVTLREGVGPTAVAAGLRELAARLAAISDDTLLTGQIAA